MQPAHAGCLLSGFPLRYACMSIHGKAAPGKPPKAGCLLFQFTCMYALILERWLSCSAGFPTKSHISVCSEPKSRGDKFRHIVEHLTTQRGDPVSGANKCFSIIFASSVVASSIVASSIVAPSIVASSIVASSIVASSIFASSISLSSFLPSLSHLPFFSFYFQKVKGVVTSSSDNQVLPPCLPPPPPSLSSTLP